MNRIVDVFWELLVQDTTEFNNKRWSAVDAGTGLLHKNPNRRQPDYPNWGAEQNVHGEP